MRWEAETLLSSTIAVVMRVGHWKKSMPGFQMPGHFPGLRIDVNGFSQRPNPGIVTFEGCDKRPPRGLESTR